MKKMTHTLLIPFVLSFALLWLMVASPAMAAADLVASFVFGPEVTYPTNNLGVGDTFTATVHITSASNQLVDTWGIYVNYDPTVVQVNSWTRLYPINGFDLCTVPETIDNAVGRIYAECTDLGGGTTTDGLDVLEITFEVLQTDTLFDVTFDTVCDGTGNSECFRALSGGVNQIATYNDGTNVPLAISLDAFSVASSKPMQKIWLPVVVVNLLGVTAVYVYAFLRKQR